MDWTRPATPPARHPRLAWILAIVVVALATIAVLTMTSVLERSSVPGGWGWITLLGSFVACAFLVAMHRHERHGAPLAPIVIAVGVVAAMGPAPFVADAVLDALHDRASERLASWIASDELAEIEREHGYTVGESELYPQVSRPRQVSPRARVWVASESDRASGSRALAPGARGAVITWQRRAPLALDPSHVLLGASAAEQRDELAWVALVSRLDAVEVTFDDGSRARAERVDVRVVDVANRERLGRISLGAIIPEVSEHPAARYAVPYVEVARAIERLVAADGSAHREDDPRWDVEGCVSPGEPTDRVDTGRGNCLEGVTEACIADCRRGDVDACVYVAYTLDHASAGRARPFYALACRAGDLNACTNWAAGVLRFHDDDPDALACARGIFERMCERGEWWSCGMYGGMVGHGEGGPEDDAAARALLERSCDEGNPFSCEVLGGMLDRGELGLRDRAAALAALDRACGELREGACRGAERIRREEGGER